MQRSPRIATPGPAGIVPVAPIVPRNGWWSNYPQFGEEQSFAPDAQNRQQILKADELGPPQVYTLALGISYTEQNWPGAGRAFEVEAEINFGAGGATQVVRVDWVQGAQISLPMNAVNVIATYNIDALAAPAASRELSAQRYAWEGPCAWQIAVDGSDSVLARRGWRDAAHPNSGADLNFTAGNFLIFLGGPLPADRQIASVRLDQYFNAIGEGIVIPGQAKHTTIFNLVGSVVNARARMQYDIF